MINMILQKELKTLADARKEEGVDIIPYSITDIHLYETILNMEKTHDSLVKEHSNEHMGLHMNTKHVPDWIESDEDYEEWEKGVDRDYELLDELWDTIENLRKMVKELEEKTIVYTEEA